MATKKKRDVYVNVLAHSMTNAVADTLDFSEITVGLNLFDKVGLLVSRIEYEFDNAAMLLMTTAGDNIQMGIGSSDSIPSAVVTDTQIIDLVSLTRQDFGTAASAQDLFLPLVHDFSSLPGGGLLVPPSPLYMMVGSGGLGAAITGYIRVYFTILHLSDSEYLELLETRRVFG